MRKSSVAVTLGITALVAGSVYACNSGDDFEELDADYAQVCRDETTQQRLEDRECEDQNSGASSYTGHGGHGGHGWYFVPLVGGRSVPSVGSTLTDGSSTRPTSGSTTRVSSRGGSYAKSGSVSRGGFGGKFGGSKGG